MTRPLTPRDKVAQIIKEKVSGPHFTDPSHFVAMEQDRFIAADAILTALASGSGDHAELARLAEAATEMVAARDALTAHSSTWKRLDKATVEYSNAINRLEPAVVLDLLADIAALRAACSKSNDEISQTLGKALGYPWFKDDQINFPGATAENGVCVGDHVAESLADEAARRLTEAERKLAEAVGLNERAADLMRQCTDPERFEVASTLNVYANMRAWLSDLSKEAEHG